MGFQITSHSKRQKPRPQISSRGPCLLQTWIQDNTFKILRCLLSDSLWDLNQDADLSEVVVTEGLTAVFLMWSQSWGHRFTGSIWIWFLFCQNLVLTGEASNWDEVSFSNPASPSLEAFSLNSAWKLCSSLFSSPLLMLFYGWYLKNHLSLSAFFLKASLARSTTIIRYFPIFQIEPHCLSCQQMMTPLLQPAGAVSSVLFQPSLMFFLLFLQQYPQPILQTAVSML